ncbi:MAG: hypothetical protein JNK82_22655 [Myxococcaceae bacterium]|nr:hypothetical protein [Myxococcaceae bacterium]
MREKDLSGAFPEGREPAFPGTFMGSVTLRQLILAVVAVVSGCGIAPEEAAEAEVGVSEAELFQAPNLTKWAGGLVPICFVNGAPGPEVAWTQDALAKTWATAANIGFIYSSTCPFPGRPWHVQLTFDHITDNWGSRGVADIGMLSPARTTVAVCAANNPNGCRPGQVNAADYEESFRSVVVHEVGHLLGFLHEQQRTDATPICPLTMDSNSVIVPNGVNLTPTYDADSIMNYCRGWNGVAPLPYQVGYRGAELLSVGDAQGARAAYGVRRMTTSQSVSGTSARVTAVDAFGGPVPGASVFYNGAPIATLGQWFTLPPNNGSVCVIVPPECEYGHCTKPRRECEPGVVLEVRAANFTTAKVNIVR